MQHINIMPLPALRGGGPRHTRVPGETAAFRFQLPPSASQLTLAPLSPRPWEQRPLSSLPCCRRLDPTAVNRQEAGYSPLGALQRARGFVSLQCLEQKCLSSVLGHLPQLLVVLPFKWLLLVCSTGRSWRGPSCPPWDTGTGHRFPPRQESSKHPPSVPEFLPANLGQAPPAQWCHWGGTGGPKGGMGRAPVTWYDRQGVSNGRWKTQPGTEIYRRTCS